VKPSDLALLRVVGPPTIAPDARHVVAAVTRMDMEADEYRSELWLAGTGESAAEPRKFTEGPRDRSPRYSPDGRWLAFLRSDPADAPAQLYVMPVGGGEPRRVTDHVLAAGEPTWSPGSDRVAYSSRVPEEGRYQAKRGGRPAEKEPPRRITRLRYRLDNVGFTIDRPSHLFVVDPFAPSPSPVQVTSGNFDHQDVAWSPDGQLLAFAAGRHEGSGDDSRADVWVCAADGSGLRPLTAGGLAASGPVFSPDGAAVYFTAVPLSQAGTVIPGSNCGLWSVPTDGSGPARQVTDQERFHRGTEGSPLVPAADGILFANDDRGAVTLLQVPYDGGEPRMLLGGRRVVRGFCAAADSTIAAVVADPRSAGELVVLRDGQEVQLTSFGPDFAAAVAICPAQEVTATAPDGYPVHGWVVRPAGSGPHPVLLMIHGGPFAQYTWSLFDEAQVYAGAGYAVVMGNPRGSSGYGQAHGRYIIGDVGERSAADLIALLDAALAEPGLDSRRVGVLGGSHGGYMTTWLAGRAGDRFRAAVSERAVNAIDSFSGSSDIGFRFARGLYGQDPAGWAAQSPLSYADSISTPVLIIHSEQDWRCPLEQAQRLFVALKLRGSPAELLLFPGEGHELSRSGLPSHRVARFEAILEWFARWLSA
jgi:dipeptidyl aminopeptidase/acylaminoacyl peptidase